MQSRMGSSKAGKRKASAMNGETDNLPVGSRRGPGRPKAARVSTDCSLVYYDLNLCSASVWLLCFHFQACLMPGTLHNQIPGLCCRPPQVLTD